MKKIVIITMASVAAGILTTLLLKRRKQITDKLEPALQKAGNAGKHLTNVFSRAKEHGL